MREGWTGCFAGFPDYKIVVSEIFQDGYDFALIGTARGAYSGNGRLLRKKELEVPVAWEAVVDKGQLSEWRVFSDSYKTATLLRGSGRDR